MIKHTQWAQAFNLFIYLGWIPNCNCPQFAATVLFSDWCVKIELCMCASVRVSLVGHIFTYVWRLYKLFTYYFQFTKDKLRVIFGLAIQFHTYIQYTHTHIYGERNWNESYNHKNRIKPIRKFKSGQKSFSRCRNRNLYFKMLGLHFLCGNATVCAAHTLKQKNKAKCIKLQFEYDSIGSVSLSEFQRSFYLNWI